MARYSALRNQMVRGNEGTYTYAANGAISIADGVHAITKTSLAAMTLAAPAAADEGTELTIVSRTAFAHTITVSGGIGGRGTAADVVTLSNIGDSITLFVDNALWANKGGTGTVA